MSADGSDPVPEHVLETARQAFTQRTVCRHGLLLDDGCPDCLGPEHWRVEVLIDNEWTVAHADHRQRLNVLRFLVKQADLPETAPLGDLVPSDFDEAAEFIGSETTIDPEDAPDLFDFLGRVEDAFFAAPGYKPSPRDVSLYERNTYAQTPSLRRLLAHERPLTADDLAQLHAVFTEGGEDAGVRTFTLAEFVHWLNATGDWEGTCGAEVVW